MTQSSLPSPDLEAELGALRAACPTQDALAARMAQELADFEQAIRDARPHWSTRMPGRDWTPAQEADHTIKVNENTGRLIRLLLSGKPLRETPRQEGQLKDGRRQAPAGTEPGPEQSAEALIERNAATRALLVDVRPEPDPARTFFHPFLGDLDALDWLRMAAYQTRHHRQTMQAGLDRLNAGEHA